MTDWQQETRGLFLWPELWDMPVGSTRNDERRWSAVRSTSGKHTRTRFVFMAIFTTRTCFVLKFRRPKLYASPITGM